MRPPIDLSGHSATWLRAQLSELAQSAEDTALADASRVEADPIRALVHEARSALARHYARELRRILRGQAWVDALRNQLFEGTNT